MVLAAAVPVIMAQSPSITPQDAVPQWGEDSAMLLSMFTAGGDILPFTYTVVPLTQNQGLNQTETARKVRRTAPRDLW